MALPQGSFPRNAGPAPGDTAAGRAFAGGGRSR